MVYIDLGRSGIQGVTQLGNTGKSGGISYLNKGKFITVPSN